MRTLATLFAIALTVSLLGCTAEEQGVAGGAAMGAVLGAVVGNQTDNSWEGAAVGALAGSIVGYHIGKAQGDSERVYVAEPLTVNFTCQEAPSSLTISCHISAGNRSLFSRRTYVPMPE